MTDRENRTKNVSRIKENNKDTCIGIQWETSHLVPNSLCRFRLEGPGQGQRTTICLTIVIVLDHLLGSLHSYCITAVRGTNPVQKLKLLGRKNNVEVKGWEPIIWMFRV